MIHDLRGDHKLALRTDKVILSVSVILYHLWMIRFVFYKWGHHVATILLPTLGIPIATFILHATYQMDCIFALLNAKPDKVPHLASKWPAYLSICFNTAMSLHVATVLTAYYTEWSLLTTIGVFPLVGCEILHRLLAIRTFQHLLDVHNMIASSYWSFSKEEDTRNDKKEFVSQNTVPQIYYQNSSLVTGYEMCFRHLQHCSDD